MYKIPADKDNRITILALNWRDIRSKKAGGAEIHTHAILKGADPKKYRIFHIAMEDEGAETEFELDGVTYLRKGGALGVITYARKFYHANEDQIDFVIDQCNTHRFFTGLWVPAEKRIFYIHQLTREICDIHMGFPFNKIGKAMETPFLRLQKKDTTITISQSTKDDLVAVGFDEKKVHVVPEYFTTEPWTPEQFDEKRQPTQFVYVGRYAKYKGIDVSIEALAKIKEKFPDTRLVVVGKKDEDYVKKSLKPLCDKCSLTLSDTDRNADVYLTGFVTDEEKLHFQSESHCLLFPSIREGWGLIITEAAIVGTPSIVYDAPGSRDAVARGKAGYLTAENTVDGLAKVMLHTLEDKESYEKMRKAAYDFSTEYIKWGKRVDVIDDIITKMQRGR